MMKKINKYGSIALLTITAAIFTGCSDQFLEDKKLYGSFNGTTIYENYESADNRIAYLYYIMLPSATGGSDLTGSMGDMQAQEQVINIRNVQKNMEGYQV